MIDAPRVYERSKKAFLILSLSLFIMLYWIIGSAINVYFYPVVSVIFEILWLPVLILTFALPVLSFMWWSKEHYSYKSIYLYSILAVFVGAIVANVIH